MHHQIVEVFTQHTRFKGHKIMSGMYNELFINNNVGHGILVNEPALKAGKSGSRPMVEVTISNH